jgi:putative ABC transport system ATP-binding protein
MATVRSSSARLSIVTRLWPRPGVRLTLRLGQSTLLGILAGLDLLSGGSVNMLGADLFAEGEDGRAALRRRHGGFVFRSFQRLPHLTALENVMLPLQLRGERDAQNAFVTEPPLLLADEPTGSLDAASGELAIDLMFKLNRESGSTLILVTHGLSVAARCGRTVTMRAGRLYHS